VAAVAAERVVAAVRDAVAARGRAFVALAGGTTPMALYRRLAAPCADGGGSRELMPWSRIDWFLGDERLVPPDHAECNYRMIRASLFAHAGADLRRLHRPRTELQDAAAIAQEYDAELLRAFGIGVAELPCFDLVLLGMGADGHTASLFPADRSPAPAPAEFDSPFRSPRVALPWVHKLGARRLTLTAAVFNNARQVLFLVSGAEKAPALAQVLTGAPDPARWPSQQIRPVHGNLCFVVDEAAAGLLSRVP
jgi:6-phosphogluconolactonase